MVNEVLDIPNLLYATLYNTKKLLIVKKNGII